MITIIIRCTTKMLYRICNNHNNKCYLKIEQRAQTVQRITCTVMQQHKKLGNIWDNHTNTMFKAKAKKLE